MLIRLPNIRAYVQLITTRGQITFSGDITFRKWHFFHLEEAKARPLSHGATKFQDAFNKKSVPTKSLFFTQSLDSITKYYSIPFNMWESFQEKQRELGPSHPGHEPLISRPFHQPYAAQIAEKPSDRLTRSAEKYLKWLTAPQVDDQARYDMMSTAMNTAVREVQLIKIIRQLCPDMRVDKPNSDIGWNENFNTVFLFLHLKGTHTGYLPLKRC